MGSTANEFPSGNSAHTIRTTKESGHVVRLQRQKVLDLLDILGLEVVIQPKTSRTL
jgi:hypothetical protein